jgi:hypothetical protein
LRDLPHMWQCDSILIHNLTSLVVKWFWDVGSNHLESMAWVSFFWHNQSKLVMYIIDHRIIPPPPPCWNFLACNNIILFNLILSSLPHWSSPCSESLDIKFGHAPRDIFLISIIWPRGRSPWEDFWTLLVNVLVFFPSTTRLYTCRLLSLVLFIETRSIP